MTSTNRSTKIRHSIGKPGDHDSYEVGVLGWIFLPARGAGSLVWIVCMAVRCFSCLIDSRLRRHRHYEGRDTRASEERGLFVSIRSP
jgi:hypothetical protein